MHSGRVGGMRVPGHVKERPILFSAQMVRALLDGRKTQTRRVIKPAPEVFDHQVPIRPEPRGGGKWIFMAYSDRPSYQFATSDRKCPYGVPGDRLWVRETWRTLRRFDSHKPRNVPAGTMRAYEADAPYIGDCRSAPAGRMGKLRPSIFLPRWASRITLAITDVRVQRLQEISEADARAEGVPYNHACFHDSIQSSIENTAIRNYAVLWDRLNAKRGYGWDVNPWVWAISFKRP